MAGALIAFPRTDDLIANPATIKTTVLWSNPLVVYKAINAAGIKSEVIFK